MFGAEDLGALLERLGTGRFTARQLSAVIAAGMRGGGHDVTDAEVAQMRFDGGLAASAAIVSELLSAALGGAGEGRQVRENHSPNPRRPQEG